MENPSRDTGHVHYAVVPSEFQALVYCVIVLLNNGKLQITQIKL